MTKPVSDFASPSLPKAQGLYDPRHEHDACGIGFVANIKGQKSHQIVEQGLQILVNLTHRGAVGADPKAGDGAGILVQIPEKLLCKVLHTTLGITIGGGWIAVNATKVPLAPDEGIPQGERLSHSHERVVDRLVAVWMVFTHDFTDDLCALGE